MNVADLDEDKEQKYVLENRDHCKIGREEKKISLKRRLHVRTDLERHRAIVISSCLLKIHFR